MSASECFAALTIPGMQITALEEVRERVKLPKDKRGPEDLEIAAGVHGLSEIELNTFIDMAEARYRAKRMDPGEVASCCHCCKCYLSQGAQRPHSEACNRLHIRVVATSWKFHVMPPPSSFI